MGAITWSKLTSLMKDIVIYCLIREFKVLLKAALQDAGKAQVSNNPRESIRDGV
jgi:hypothetical protein